MDELDVKANIKVEPFEWPEEPTEFPNPEASVENSDQQPDTTYLSFPTVQKEELIIDDEALQYEPHEVAPEEPPELIAPGGVDNVFSNLRSGKISCTICQQSFLEKCDLQRHQREDHKQLYCCQTCDKSFDKPCLLKRHAPFCKGRPLYCATCDKTFDAVRAWYTHRAWHRSMENKKFACQVCHKPFATRSSSLQHEWEVHKLIRPELADEVTICKICDKPCFSKDSYEQHLQVHVNIENKTFQCKICEKCFGSEIYLKGHITRQECEKKAMLGANGVFNCTKCSKTFGEQILLIRHMRRHAHIMNGTYKCSLCGKPFASNKELKAHTKNNHKTSKTSHRCHICDRTIPTQSMLEKHLTTHDDSSPKQKKPSELSRLVNSLKCYKSGLFPCSECEKTFATRDLCVRHVKWHKKVAKGTFTCQICGLSHGSNAELKNHLITHDTNLPSNGESSSAADDCSTKDTLWYDRRVIAIKNETFECETCGERFGLQKELKQHHAIHPEMAEEGPCSKTF